MHNFYTKKQRSGSQSACNLYKLETHIFTKQFHCINVYIQRYVNDFFSQTVVTLQDIHSVAAYSNRSALTLEWTE